MRKLIVATAFLIAFYTAKAQDITGSWLGGLPVHGITLHLVFNIKKISDTGYTATFDSPDQKAFGIACNTFYFKKDSVAIGVATIGGSYNGHWDGRDSISGTFKQVSHSFPIGLKRMTDAQKAVFSQNVVRAQTPKQPYGYYSEDVEYDNADKSLHYGATFTRPNGDGKYPAVIIISGSGTQDRNGTMLGHQPYWVLADYLTKNGIAVLRVDDRGAGKSSLGPDINNRTSLDFSYDVETSLNYLETRADVDKKHLGLIGHSEGGMIAPMVAARRKDVSFIVLWAGPALTGAQISTEQSALEMKQQGVDSVSVAAASQLNLEILRLFNSPTQEILNQKITGFFETWKKGQSPKTLATLHIDTGSVHDITKTYDNVYKSGWIRFFMTYDPTATLAKVKCPVLAINGEKDTQVIAAENLSLIKAVLTKSGNKDFEVNAIPGLNHLMQTANTGYVSEYESLPETMSPVAMKIISDWIKLHTK